MPPDNDTTMPEINGAQQLLLVIVIVVLALR
jgi:hypothetical protein